MSEEYKSVIATKFQSKALETCAKPYKWKLRLIGDKNSVLFETNSEMWREIKTERVSVMKRKALVKIGNDKNCGLHPLEITFSQCLFTEQELEAIYVGSHLENGINFCYSFSFLSLLIII
jgi:hypothetical protein